MNTPRPEQDPSLLEHTQALVGFLVAATGAIVRHTDLGSLYAKICALADAADTRIALAWVALLNGDGTSVRIAAKAGEAQAYLDGIVISLDPGHPQGQGPTARAIRERRCVSSNDFSSDPRMAPWCERAASFGLVASIAIPLMNRGTAVGALMLYSTAPSIFDAGMVKMLAGLGQNISLAIELDAERQAKAALDEELRRSNMRYQLLAENIRDVIWLLDTESRRFSYVSPSVRSLLGWSVDEVMAGRLADITTAESFAASVQWLKDDLLAWEHGSYQPRTAEVELRHRDGSTLWVEVLTQLFLDSESGRLVLSGVTREVTEHRALTQLLERNQLSLHTILDATDESIAMVDVTGTILKINNIGAQRFGGTPSTLIGKNLYELLPEPAAATRRRHIAEALSLGKPVEFQDERFGRIMRSRIFPVGTDAQRVVFYSSDVTDLVRSEGELQKSRARLELALSGANESIWEINVVTGDGYWSPKFYEQLGYERDEFAASRDSWLAHMHPDDREPTMASMQSQLAAGANLLAVEFRFRHKDGRWRWISGRGQVTERGEDGHPIVLAGTNMDFTERKEAEEARLRQAERGASLLRLTERAEVLAEHELLSYGLEEAERLTESKMGFLHFVNDDQETISLVTWTKQALTLCQAIHDDHYPISQAGIWADAFRQRRPVVISDYPQEATPGQLPTGHAPMSRLISVPVVENDKVRLIAGVGNKEQPYNSEDVDFVQLLLTDLWRIVQRKRAEAQLRIAVSLVEASPVVSFRWLASDDWPVAYVSSNVVRWGYTPAQLMAGVPRYAEMVHPDDLARIADEVSRHTAAGFTEYSQQYRVRAADGHYFWVEDHTRVVRDDAGKPLQFEGVVTDIDAQKRAEEKLVGNLAAQRELNRKLEEAQNQLLQSEKMASIGQLAAGVAHELNNPIGFVHSNLGTLDNYLKDIFAIADAYAKVEAKLGTHEAWKAVDALKQSKDFEFLRSDIAALLTESREGLNRVKKIVQDLKDFSRVGEVDWQWADLHHGIDSTLNIVWNELKYKCTVTKDYAKDLPLIRCLPSQLNQVVMNLLVNAAHAIESKGEITIRTRVHDAASVQLIISDNGKGIAEDVIERIFEPFYTTKPVGKGTGLGLSIVWGIIGKHHGHIDVASKVGVGTTFTITLPIDPPEDTASEAEAPAKKDS